MAPAAAEATVVRAGCCSLFGVELGGSWGAEDSGGSAVGKVEDVAGENTEHEGSDCAGGETQGGGC